jgi:hypothetical protein
MCMLRSIGYRGKLGQQLKRLRLDIVGEVDKFTKNVSAALGIALQGRVKSDSLASGAFHFFLYALVRALTLKGNDAEVDAVLREVISSASVADLSSETVEKAYPNIKDLRARVEQWNAHLAGTSSLTGTRLDDRNSALWIAAVHISAEAGPPEQELLIFIVQSRLLFGLMELNLARRAETILTLMR